MSKKITRANSAMRQELLHGLYRAFKAHDHTSVFEAVRDVPHDFLPTIVKALS